MREWRGILINTHLTPHPARFQPFGGSSRGTNDGPLIPEFAGLPMIKALYGRGGLSFFVDQLGSYLVLSIARMVVIAVYGSEDRTSVLAVARKHRAVDLCSTGARLVLL